MSATTPSSPSSRALFNADISAPAFKKHLIRNHLLALIKTKNKKLCLIQAPPGYGKTSFMKQIADTLVMPKLWLNIRQTDNDPMNLLHKLNSALGGVNGVRPHGSDPINPAQPPMLHQTSGFTAPSIPLWTRSLIDQMNKQVQLAIFLNDADFIQDSESAEIINLLLQMSHSGIQVFITASSSLHFSYSHLLIENQVTELTQEALCFSPEDIQAMFALHQGPKLESALAEQLTELSEGWPAAAFYMASTLETVDAVQRFIADANLKQQAFDRFFIERVFEQQAADIQQLLLRLSLLDRFNLDICRALSDSPQQCKAFWAYVEQHTFITPIEASGQWYRFHQLFALFLRHRCQLEFSETMRNNWLLKAAQCFFEASAIEEAIPLALQAKHFHQAAQWLENAFPVMVVGMGKHQTYHRWYDSLPEDIVQAFPRLRIGSIWAQVANRQFLNVAEQIQWLIQHKADYPDAIQQEIMRTAGLVYCCMEGLKDNAEKAAPLVEAWLKRWQDPTCYNHSDHRHYEMGLALLIKGYCAKCLSSFQDARQAFHQSIQHLEAFGSYYGITLAKSLLAVTYAKQGFHHEAQREALEAFQLAKVKLGEKSHNGFGLAALLAAIHYEHDEIEAARPYLKDTLPYLKEQSPSDLLIAAFETQARILVYDQAYEEAFGFLKDGIKWAETQALPRLKYKLLDELIVALIRQKRYSQAERYASEYDLILRGADAFKIQLKEHNIAARSIIYCLWQPKAYAEADSILQQLLARSEQKGQLRRQAEWLKLAAINYDLNKQTALADQQCSKLLQLAAPQHYFRMLLDEPEFTALLTRLENSSKATLKPLNRETQQFFTHLMARLKPLGHDQNTKLIEALTAKEIEIIKALAEGLPNKKIAEALLVSLGTLKWHLHNIYSKLNVKNRTQALLVARQQGYL